MSRGARQLLKTRIGYRTELPYAEKVRLATEVFRHEVSELGNAHVLDELQIFLHLSKKLTLLEALKAIESAVGKDGIALWLGTKKSTTDTCIRPYAGGDPVTQHLDRYHIPYEAISSRT